MKEIYVFGAGASHASGGTPLGNELGWSYFSDTSTLYRMEHGKPAPDDIKKKKEDFITYKQFLILARKTYPELKEDEKFERALYNGESYFPPYNLAKRYYLDEMLRILHEDKDEKSVRLIKKLVFEHIVESSFYSQNSLYKKFLNLRLKYKTGENITIISLNFDTLLREYYDNGIDKGIYIDYLIDFDYIDRREYKYKNNIFSVIKLHGSFDWGICKECNKIGLFHWHLRRFSYNKRCKYCKGILEPFIILPHEKNNKKIDVLWNKSKENLRKAEKITIIGYSFPLYDKKVIELFANSMDPDVELEVVDYEERQENIEICINEIQQNYRKMFPHIKRDIKIELGGFEKYITN